MPRPTNRQIAAAFREYATWTRKDWRKRRCLLCDLFGCNCGLCEKRAVNLIDHGSTCTVVKPRKYGGRLCLVNYKRGYGTPAELAAFNRAMKKACIAAAEKLERRARK